MKKNMQFETICLGLSLFAITILFPKRFFVCRSFKNYDSICVKKHFISLVLFIIRKILNSMSLHQLKNINKIKISNVFVSCVFKDWILNHVLIKYNS